LSLTADKRSAAGTRLSAVEPPPDQQKAEGVLLIVPRIGEVGRRPIWV